MAQNFGGLIVGGANMVTKIVIVFPLYCLALATLWYIVFGESTRPKYALVSDCSIAGIATGSVMERREKVDGVAKVETACSLHFLPGKWVTTYNDHYWDCAITATGEKGHRTKTRTPGETGLKVTEIETCFVRRLLSSSSQ